jgi:hypothetical protein
MAMIDTLRREGVPYEVDRKTNTVRGGFYVPYSLLSDFCQPLPVTPLQSLLIAL